MSNVSRPSSITDQVAIVTGAAKGDNEPPADFPDLDEIS